MGKSPFTVPKYHHSHSPLSCSIYIQAGKLVVTRRPVPFYTNTSKLPGLLPAPEEHTVTQNHVLIPTLSMELCESDMSNYIFDNWIIFMAFHSKVKESGF